MKNKFVPFFETALILLGEVVISIIICAVYLLINRFTYRVVTGVLLGSAVTVLNFLFLSISTNRAFDKAIEARGTKEMSEEEIEKFTEEHQGNLQNAVKLSFFIRTFSMMAALILAFLIKDGGGERFFDVIATLVPILMLRPIITLESLLRNKFKKEDN